MRRFYAAAPSATMLTVKALLIDLDGVVRIWAREVTAAIEAVGAAVQQLRTPGW